MNKGLSTPAHGERTPSKEQLAVPTELALRRIDEIKQGTINLSRVIASAGYALDLEDKVKDQVIFEDNRENAKKPEGKNLDQAAVDAARQLVKSATEETSKAGDAA